MKILITGSTGLLGQALSRHLTPSAEVVGLSRHTPVERTERVQHVVCDLSDVPRTTSVLRDARPDVVIHTQAMSNVDQCELDPHAAQTMNVTTTQSILRALPSPQTFFVHVSTDYVFDGARQRPYDEHDAPHPLSVYGRSKLEGERLALGYPKSLVIRPSTLFGQGRMNFCDHIVEQLQRGGLVEAFIDQQTSPTYTEDLAEAIARLLQTVHRSAAPLPSRILHLANAGGVSRYEFAQRVATLLGISPEGIRGIRMAEQRRPAPRPSYSVLTSCYASSVIGDTLPPWDNALERYLRQRHWIN